jgi:hypothetical protein
MAGKQTMIQAYGDRLGVSVQRERVVQDSVPLWTTRLEVPASGASVFTIPGRPWRLDLWWPFVDTASAVVLALDSQESREAADRDCLDGFFARPSVPRIRAVVWTKRDLVASGTTGEVTRSLAEDPRLSGWRSFFSRTDHPDTARAPIDWILSQLRDDARP